MNRKILLLAVCLVCAVGFGTWQVWGQDKPEAPATGNRAFMRLKLQHAQGVLEGLTSENFEEIAKHGQASALLSHESNWKVLQSPDYNEHSADFRRICGSLVKHAKAKNLEAATLDYLLLTTNCVQCHKYVRNERGSGK